MQVNNIMTNIKKGHTNAFIYKDNLVVENYGLDIALEFHKADVAVNGCDCYIVAVYHDLIFDADGLICASDWCKDFNEAAASLMKIAATKFINTDDPEPYQLLLKWLVEGCNQLS